MSEIHKIHQDLVEKKYTCLDLIQGKLDALKDSPYNSSNFLLNELAIKKAKEVDAKISNGEKITLLEGVPFGLKDVYLLQGTYASASSDMLKQYKAPYTASSIQKLIDAGAIPIVKENCDSFGHGSTSENTVFGPVKNANDESLVAGGSSGGSAVNVAKGFTTFSIGGDTGGSIRQPAGYNKVYGLKPTYGRISRYGLMAYASSTDCVGPFSKSLEDILILLNLMSGNDYHDQTNFATEPISFDSIKDTDSTKRLRIAYYGTFLNNEALDPKIKSDFLDAIEKIKAAGFSVKELDFYNAQTLVATYYTLAMAETASNLSRLDGINYGMRSKGENLKEAYSISRSENFTEETKRRIVAGNQVLSHGHAEEIYLKARAQRVKIMETFEKEFQEVDVILSPVAPNLPPKIGENLKKPIDMYLSDAYTVGFSLGGLPTLTVPFGTDIGMQITADKNKEESILSIAHFLKGIL